MSKRTQDSSIVSPRTFAMTAIAAAIMAFTSGAQAAEFVITTSSDWSTGVLTNTNSLPPPNTGDGHVRLEDAILTPFDHIWVALSGRGTASAHRHQCRPNDHR